MANPIYKMGNNVSMGSWCVYDSRTVRFGANVILEHFIEIQDHCEIGDHVTIRSFCRIGHHCRIGAGATLKNGVILSPHIHIGTGVFVSPNVVFMNRQQEDRAGTAVHANAFIGTGAIIAPGVTIGDHAFIAAGTLVSRDVPSGRAVAGSPMRELKTPARELKRKVLG